MNRWNTQRPRGLQGSALAPQGRLPGDAAMDSFAYASTKHQWDQKLLDRLSEAIYVLKLGAQQQLAAHGLDSGRVQAAREALDAFLAALEERVGLYTDAATAGKADLAFTGLADRFVHANPHDVPDRVAELERLRERLQRGQELRGRDFTLLDRLQSFLEEEAAEGVRGLYQL